MFVIIFKWRRIIFNIFFNFKICKEKSGLKKVTQKRNLKRNCSVPSSDLFVKRNSKAVEERDRRRDTRMSVQHQRAEKYAKLDALCAPTYFLFAESCKQCMYIYVCVWIWRAQRGRVMLDIGDGSKACAFPKRCEVFVTLEKMLNIKVYFRN